MQRQPLFDQKVPSPEEIQAAIRRAHRERSEALRRLLGTLFRRRKVRVAEREHAPSLGAAVCR
jgi:ribosomal 50S subunit-associated protein YjgA (DUF615 family)